MAETELARSRCLIPANAEIIDVAETVGVGTAAETLATAGATIPSNCTAIIIIPDGELRFHVGTPTTTWGHLLEEDHAMVIPHDKIGAYKFKATAGAADENCILVYLGYK